MKKASWNIWHGVTSQAVPPVHANDMRMTTDDNNDLHSIEIVRKITGEELQNGGIKMWVYNTVKHTGAKLNVSFVNTQTTPGCPRIASQFNISLDFTVTD